MTRSALFSSTLVRRRSPYTLVGISLQSRRSITHAVAPRSPGTTSVTSLPVQYVLPPNWLEGTKQQPLNYIFYFAFSKLRHVKQELDDAQLALNFAKNVRDPRAIKAAYAAYLDAAHRLTALPVRSPAYHHFQNAMTYVGDTMDILASSDDPADRAMIPIMSQDIDILWWPALQHHVSKDPEAYFKNWFNEIRHLVRYGRRDKALRLLFYLEKERNKVMTYPTDSQTRWRPPRGPAAEADIDDPMPLRDGREEDLRPCWRAVLDSYCNEGDWHGAADLVYNKMKEQNVYRPTRRTMEVHFIFRLCGLQSPEAVQWLMIYVPALYNESAEGTIAQTATLLRAFTRLGRWDLAAIQAAKLDPRSDTTRIPSGGDEPPVRLSGYARDALLEYAIGLSNLDMAWSYVEKMVVSGQMPVASNIRALIQLDEQHRADLALFKPPTSGQEVSASDSNEGGGAPVPRAEEILSDGNDITGSQRVALRSIFRALGSQESSAQQALEIYRNEKLRQGKPDTLLAFPIIKWLCSQTENASDSLDQAFELFNEFAAAPSVPKTYWDAPQVHTTQRPRGGPDIHICSALLETLIVRPDLHRIRAVLAEVHLLGHQGKKVRSNLLNNAVEISIALSRDHQESMDIIQHAFDLLPDQLSVVDVFRRWTETIYVQSDSHIPPAELFVSFWPLFNGVAGRGTNPAGRAISLLRRYYVLTRHISATFGDSDRGKAHMQKLHECVTLIHQHVIDPPRDSPLRHPTMAKDLPLVYGGLMDCYLGFGKYAEVIRLFEELRDQGRLNGPITSRTMRAYQLAGDWKGALATWTRLRKPAVLGSADDTSSPGTLLETNKTLWDDYCAALIPGGFTLRAAADAVRSWAMTKAASNHAASGRSQELLRADCDTAAYMMRMAEESEEPRAREVMEKDFRDFFTLLYKELGRLGRLKYLTPEEEATIGTKAPAGAETWNAPKGYQALGPSFRPSRRRAIAPRGGKHGEVERADDLKVLSTPSSALTPKQTRMMRREIGAAEERAPS